MNSSRRKNIDEPMTDYATPRAAFAAGARDAAGAPVVVLAAGYVGYGALASGFDFPPLLIVASTLIIWALPGQLIMLEMHAVNAQLVLIVLAVSLSASRFLPMTTVLSAMMRHPRYASWQMYASAHLLAMTGWVAAVNRVPQLPAEQRLPYFVGFALFCWIACAVASAAGYFLAGQMSELVKLGLVFHESDLLSADPHRRNEGCAGTPRTCCGCYHGTGCLYARPAMEPAGRWAGGRQCRLRFASLEA